jgi:hypothetical protein
MKFTTPLMLAAALIAVACGVHTQTGEGTDADDAKAQGDQGVGPGAAGGAGAQGGCAIPDGFNPGTPSLSMPQVVAPGGVTFERELVMIEIGEDGKVMVAFEFSALNKGEQATELAVGYAWRLKGTGPAERGTGIDFKLDDGAIETCAIEGPPEMQQPFRDEVRFARFPIGPDDSITVKGSLMAQVDQADKPTTLFGYHDRFADNWKNWDWPYTKSKPYAAIADKLRPFHGRFHLGPGGRAQIDIRPRSGDAWIRAMSHEQNVEKLRMSGAYRWEFYGENKPDQIEFEYVVGLTLHEEIEVFRKIIKKNRHDLRARIRLADLAGFAGDPAARADIIESLLKAWNKNAKEQLLIKRNDVRGPAYVALVKSLLAIDDKQAAAKYAAEGVELLDSFDDDFKKLEMNRLARRWLAQQQ